MIQVKEEGRYDHSLWKQFTNGVLFPKEYSFCFHCWVLNVPALYREIASFTLMFVFMVFLLGRKKFEYEFNKI